MARLLLVLVAILIPFAAFAQNETDTNTGTPDTTPAASADEQPAGEATDETATEPEEPQAEIDMTTLPESGVTYVPYTSDRYGFTISLPETGMILDEQTEGWSQPEEIACYWVADGAEPVKAIQVRADKFQAEIDMNTFANFCQTLLSNWTEDPNRYTIYTRNAIADFGTYKWNLIEVSDGSHESGVTVYYSVFSTLSEDTIYTVTLYYMMPASDTIKAFGGPIVDSFSE